MSDCTVYIDESGDLGVNRGTQWFVLTAIVVDRTAEPAMRSIIHQVRNKLSIKEIHFKNIQNFYKRAYVVRELSRTDFTYMNVLVDTSQFDLNKIPSPSIAYNYVCKYLLQRVSSYLRMCGKTGDIVLSSRGTSRDGELIQYIKDKLLPYPSNHIDASLFGKVSAKAAAEWDLLQLADVCATSTFLAYERNEWGFCIPCFSYALQNHLYRRQNKVDTYGIKFFQPDMKPDIADLHANRICGQKERTPGATTT